MYYYWLEATEMNIEATLAAGITPGGQPGF